MAKQTVKLVLEVVIEIIDWFKTREEKESGRDESDKGKSKKK